MCNLHKVHKFAFSCCDKNSDQKRLGRTGFIWLTLRIHHWGGWSKIGGAYMCALPCLTNDCHAWPLNCCRTLQYRHTCVLFRVWQMTVRHDPFIVVELYSTDKHVCSFMSDKWLSGWPFHCCRTVQYSHTCVLFHVFLFKIGGVFTGHEEFFLDGRWRYHVWFLYLNFR